MAILGSDLYTTIIRSTDEGHNITPIQNEGLSIQKLDSLLKHQCTHIHVMRCLSQVINIKYFSISYDNIDSQEHVPFAVDGLINLLVDVSMNEFIHQLLD